jgi:S1-C subfamily serine protease
MRPRKIGEKVKVKVLRGDEEIEVEVTLGRG